MYGNFWIEKCLINYKQKVESLCCDYDVQWRIQEFGTGGPAIGHRKIDRSIDRSIDTMIDRSIDPINPIDQSTGRSIIWFSGNWL